MFVLSNLKLVESNLSNTGKSKELSNLFILLSNDVVVSLKSILYNPATSLGTDTPPAPSNLTDELSNFNAVLLKFVVRTDSSNVSVLLSNVIKLLSNAFTPAPVDEITINNLNKKKTTIKEKNISSEFNYSIKIADFFFMNSAKLLKDRILNESPVKNINILEISKNKFRVILGPYLDLKSLQKDYSNIYNLNFENLEIIKND